jgi:hypothetical protein
MFTSADGTWRVRPVELDQPLRPCAMASLPGAPAEHLCVTRHGFVVANVPAPRLPSGLLDLAALAAVLPFPLAELRPA